VWEFDVQDGVPFFPLLWVDVLIELICTVFTLPDQSDLRNGVCLD
jgi:hypothetical protein